VQPRGNVGDVSAGAPFVIDLFGELEVRSGGRPLALPQSKKTRALLAYLALTERVHRREQLCRLFWDVTDDPRGALRWSLSKLRGLFEGAEANPIVTERDLVQFDSNRALVDLRRLRRATQESSPDALETSELLALAALRRGEALEGLDLPDFDDYQAFCVAEREDTRRRYGGVLRALTDRLAETPERAVSYARTLVQLDPLDDAARARLITLLGACGRPDEARQHYESGIRLERELGRPPQGSLRDAMAVVAAGPSRIAPAVVPDVPRQTISEPPRAVPGSIVGRAEELRAFASAADESVRARAPSLRVIAGEPGVGKTAFLKTAASALDPGRFRVFYAASFEEEGGNPYGAWRTARRADRGASSEALSSAGFGEFTAHAGSDGGRERLFDALATRLGTLAASVEALVLMFDDAQWLDPGSVELLSHVLRTHSNRPLVLVLAARDGELADNPYVQRLLRGARRELTVTEGRLEPLGAAETAVLARAANPAADAARIARESGGNPLFALELARASRHPDELPHGITALVRDRLTQLPTEAADVLRWAAVLGRGFALEELVSLSSLDANALLDAVELLERRSVLRAQPGSGPHAEYHFSHELMRRVVYSDLSDPRKRLMHRRVAEHLSRSGSPREETVVDLARHAALADDPALASGACLSAARRSLRLFATDDAHRLAKRSARYAERLDEPLRTERLIDAWHVSLGARPAEDPKAAAATIEALAERALDLGLPNAARLAFHALSYVDFERGAIADAQKHMTQAELVSRGGSEHERILGLAEAARCLLMLDRDLDRAQAMALEAAARARHAAIDAPPVFAALGMLKLYQGHLDDAAAYLERARGLSHVARERQEEFVALEHLVMVELARPNVAAALEGCETLVAIGEKLRGGSELRFAVALRALCRFALSPESNELEGSLEGLRAADAKHRLAFVLNRAADVELARARIEKAASHASEALVLAELVEHASERAYARLLLARCASARSDQEGRDSQLAELARTAATVAAPVRDKVRAELGAHGPSDVEEVDWRW
jgi:DNA-binding SARP family transcriptional activator